MRERVRQIEKNGVVYKGNAMRGPETKECTRG